MRAKLVGDSGLFFFRRSIKLRQLPVVIGRGRDSDIRLDDPLVSRQHCEIDELDGALVVRDLGSTNGTLVNGSSISEATLLPGDQLTVGKSQFLASYRLRLTSPRTPGRHIVTEPDDEETGQVATSGNSALSRAG